MGDFPGLCKILHETTLLVTSMEPHGIPVVHTCLFRTFVGSGLSWLYFGWMMEAIGRRWSLMNLILHDGCQELILLNVGLPDDRRVILSMSVGRDPRPPEGSGRGLLSRPLVSALKL